MNPPIPLSELLDFAVDAAWQAGKITLEYFQTNLEIRTKSDSSPVTIADKRAEEKLRELITSRYPDHSITGEEFPERSGDSPYRWILDPIDGTASFIRGVGLYGVLVALERTPDPAEGSKGNSGEPECILGVANFPALGELVYAAKGMGCYWNGRRAHVSSVKDLSQATLLMTDVPHLYRSGKGAAYERIAESVALQRTWGDCYGHILVATGRAEIMLDPAMHVWDNGPLLPILKEAGGTFTDWNGEETIRGGNAISTNGELYEQVMNLIKADSTNKAD
jgi:histidinol-phosphatase